MKTEKNPLQPVKIMLHAHEMDKLAEKDMENVRPAEKNKLNEWYSWHVDYVSNIIKSAVSKDLLSLYDGAKKISKDVLEEEGKK